MVLQIGVCMERVMILGPTKLLGGHTDTGPTMRPCERECELTSMSLAFPSSNSLSRSHRSSNPRLFIMSVEILRPMSGNGSKEMGYPSIQWLAFIIGSRELKLC